MFLIKFSSFFFWYAAWVHIILIESFLFYFYFFLLLKLNRPIERSLFFCHSLWEYFWQSAFKFYIFHSYNVFGIYINIICLTQLLNNCKNMGKLKKKIYIFNYKWILFCCCNDFALKQLEIFDFTF